MLCMYCILMCFFFLMIRRPPRSTLSSSSAASDVYKRQTVLYRTRLAAHFYHLSLDSHPTHRIVASGAIYSGVPHTDDDRLNPCSVSYTHLRAHETVLDLVCRLLLEKKKKRLS
eukprot:TRINITY_DN4968_c0_g1_i12.p1 TRINITY_DN4968_c0_g1~~TRINITY_DN4968_c0_g1_i12.p1  ORF type:complete len:114 (+),score=11.98 TRINITY_DN4968_c0_g1_i12:62-403(+)